MRFFQSVLKEIPADKIIKHCYPIHHKQITLVERMGDGKCPDCDCDSWILLPKESSAVTNGGKDYCECMNCGYMTHL
jgi:hypothetical protein